MRQTTGDQVPGVGVSSYRKIWCFFWRPICYWGGNGGWGCSVYSLDGKLSLHSRSPLNFEVWWVITIYVHQRTFPDFSAARQVSFWEDSHKPHAAVSLELEGRLADTHNYWDRGSEDISSCVSVALCNRGSPVSEDLLGNEWLQAFHFQRLSSNDVFLNVKKVDKRWSARLCFWITAHFLTFFLCSKYLHFCAFFASFWCIFFKLFQHTGILPVFACLCFFCTRISTWFQIFEGLLHFVLCCAFSHFAQHPPFLDGDGWLAKHFL